MAFFGAGLAGLSQGFPTGIQEAGELTNQYQRGLDQAGLIALSNAFGMGGQQQPPPGPPPLAQGPPQPQGSPPVGPPQQAGSGNIMGMPPRGGPPNSFAGRFPATMPTPQGNVPVGPQAPMQASDPSRAGGYAALYAGMPPGGQIPQQAQPTQYQAPGGGQGQQGQGQPQGPAGLPELSQVVQQIQQANPGASPAIIASAMQQYLKNIGPFLYKDALLAYRGIGVQQRQEGIDQRQNVVDAIKTRTNALYGPDNQSYFAGRAAASATGRAEALTQPGSGGSTPMSQMQTERAFAPGGRLEIPTRAFNVVTQHLGVLAEVTKALQNGDTQRLNELRQNFAREFGSPIPTNFDAVKTIVTNEMNKAIIGGAGAVFDRAEIQSTMSKIQSPEQIYGAIQNYIKLAAGQLDGLQKSYEAGSGRKDFDQRFISPATKELMRINVGTGEVTIGGQQPTKGKIDRAAAKKAGYTDKEIDDFEAGR